MGDEEPRRCAGDGSLEVLGEAATAAKPGKGALDDPSPRQELEAFDAGWALDDFDVPASAMRQGADQLVAAIDPIGKDMAQLGECGPQTLQQRDCTVDILDIGRVHEHGEQQTVRVGDNVALAPLHPFAGIEAAWTAALG